WGALRSDAAVARGPADSASRGRGGRQWRLSAAWPPTRATFASIFGVNVARVAHGSRPSASRTGSAERACEGAASGATSTGLSGETRPTALRGQRHSRCPPRGRRPAEHKGRAVTPPGLSKTALWPRGLRARQQPEPEAREPDHHDEHEALGAH